METENACQSDILVTQRKPRHQYGKVMAVTTKDCKCLKRQSSQEEQSC